MQRPDGENALPCEGWGRGGVPCARTTLDPSRTCHAHRNLAGLGIARTGTDEHGEWRVYTAPTPTGWSVRVFRVLNGGDYGYFAKRRYVKSLPDALALRDRIAADLRMAAQSGRSEQP
jgi:hypothetical protein